MVSTKEARALVSSTKSKLVKALRKLKWVACPYKGVGHCSYCTPQVNDSSEDRQCPCEFFEGENGDRLKLGKYHLALQQTKRGMIGCEKAGGIPLR